MITIIQAFLYSADETGARQIFDVFETLLILKIPLLSKHIPQLVQFFSNAVPTAHTMTKMRLPLRIIDTLSTSLPPAQVFPALRHLITQYMAHPDPNARRGALLALGVAVKGVSEFMGPYVESAVWPTMDAGLGLADADSGVRRAACTAVLCICEWLEEAASARRAQLVPVLMHLVADLDT